MPEIYFEDEYVVLSYYPEFGIMVDQLKQKQSGPQFRKSLTGIIDMMHKYHAHKLLTLGDWVAVFTPEDIQWLTTDWSEQMHQGGWNIWALNVPADIYKRASLVPLVDNYTNKGIKTKLFMNADEALAWLKQQ